MNRRNFFHLVMATAASSLLPGCVTAPSAATAKLPAKRGIGMGTKDKRWREKLQVCGARWFYTWTDQYRRAFFH